MGNSYSDRINLTHTFFLMSSLTFLTPTTLVGITYGQFQAPQPETTGGLSLRESNILMLIQLKPHENEFLADDGYYQVSSFQINVNNSQELCPTGNCEYNIEDGEFRPNSYSGGYILEGKLKSTVTEGDTKNSKFFLIQADLDKVGSEETPSKLTELLEGEIGFGGTTFDPDFEYEVVNGTFADGELLLPGKSEVFG